MRKGRLLIPLLLSALLIESSLALESQLTHAAFLPPLDDEEVKTLAGIEASTIGSTLLQRLRSESFQEEKAQREKAILSLSQKDSPLQDFQHMLITEGFDAFDIISDQPTPRFSLRLKHSVCVALQSKRKASGKAVLLSFPLSDANTTASAFGLAKLMQAFKLETSSPLWVCAQSPNSASAAKELFEKKQSPSFSTALVLSKTDGKAYINLLGRETTQLVLKEKAWSWLKHKENTALETSQAIEKSIRLLRSSWEIDKKTPWSNTVISPIRCEKSYISSIRNSCRFDVAVISRSQVALSEKTESIVSCAVKETRQVNKNLGSPKNKPAVTLFLPKNRSRKPIAGNPQELPVLRAWRTALGTTPPKDVFISSRFIESEIASESAQRVPTAVLSCTGKSPEEDNDRLFTLAKTLLLFLGTHVQ